MTKLFKTYETGSLAKPSWRTKAYAGIKLNEYDVLYAKKWAKKLDINYPKAEKILLGDSPSKKQAILELSSLYALKMFEKAGLDYFYNGEQWRVEMYEHIIRNLYGFKLRGWIKSFDYRYFRKASAIKKIAYNKTFYLEEYKSTKNKTSKPLKMPFTGPYTLTDWTYNEHYEKKHDKIKSLPRRRYEARKDLLNDIVEALRLELEKLVYAGVKWIQIDEPAVTTKETPEEMELFAEAFNRLTEGFSITFSLHNCFSNYDILAEYVTSLKKCNHLSLELAQRDLTSEDGKHSGYDQLLVFLDNGYKGTFAPGFIDVHTDNIESSKLVMDRILYVSDLVGKDKIWVSPDCGLRTRTWDIAFQKLCNLTEGAENARKKV